MKKLTTILFLCLLCSGLQAQSWATHSELDSLLALYSPGKLDTQQVWILSRLSRVYGLKNPDSGLLLANKEMELSKSMNYEKGEADARFNVGLYWWAVGEYSISLKLLTENERFKVNRFKDLLNTNIKDIRYLRV